MVIESGVALLLVAWISLRKAEEVIALHVFSGQEMIENILVTIARVVLPPLIVFVLCEDLSSRIWPLTTCEPSISPGSLKVYIVLEYFKNLLQFNGLKLVTVALAINVTVVFNLWIDAKLGGMSINTVGVLGEFTTWIHLPPFLFFLLLIVGEMAIILKVPHLCCSKLNKELPELVHAVGIPAASLPKHDRKDPRSVEAYSRAFYRIIDEKIPRGMRLFIDLLGVAVLVLSILTILL